MAAIFTIRRGTGSIDLQDGELYLNKGKGSIQFGSGSGNEITLLPLDAPVIGDIKLQGNITASNAYFSGDVAISGNLFLGNQTSDTITATGEFQSNLVPNPDRTWDLGTNNKWWRSLYVNTISSSVISGSIAGVGNIEAFSASIDERVDRLEASSSLYDNAMSGSLRLYVSPEGSDSNDGKDPSTPFKTIKAAVQSLGDAVYTNVKRYTIFVGSGNYTEQNPIAVPPGVAIVGDTLRTVRLYAENPTQDFFHVHDSNYFYGLRFLDLKHPAFCFSFPSSTATTTISGGSIDTIDIDYSVSGYTDGTNQDLGIIIEGPNGGGTIATATADVVGGVITQINVVNGGTTYSSTEKPHISIPAPVSKRPVITTSPYIQNCSSITGPFNTSGVKVLQALPYDEVALNIDEQGAGGGIRIDGNLVHPNSPLESFVADAFTQVNQGGPGHLVINKGYAQFVSCFTTFCTYGFKTANGGFANISNSVIDFGKEGLISKTYFPTTYNSGSSLETKTSQVSGFVIDENGAGYVGSTTGVTISGGGASVQATAEATINANGSIDEIVLLTPGSGYTSQPNVVIDAPTGPGGIQATTVAGKALISGVSEMLMALESGSRGVDISSNMILNGVDYLVTDVAEVSGQPNQRRITTYPAPPSIATNAQIKFHQLSNISTGGLVMEYVGSGVTYNALPKFGGVPIRTREIIEYAPGRVFYSTVDNIGNLKIGDFFSVNQLTGEVTIDANSFNLSGLNAIGPFRRNGVAVGVVLQEVSNNTTLLNSQGLYGEDTVPTQFAVKEYVQEINTSLDGRLDKLEIASSSLNIFSGSTLSRLSNLETTSQSVNTSITNINTTTASLNVSVFNLNQFSSSQLDKDATLATYTASVETRFSTLGSLSGSFARTNSTNIFNATQIISGSLVVTQDFTVLGSSSIQNVSSSVLNIGTNIITVAVNQPAVRFGGIAVIDSGSSGQSGSFLYDSVQDEFIFLHRGNGTNITSSHFVLGPETYDNLGNEIYLTNNRLPKGTGKEHLNDSQISDDGTTVTIPGALTVTGNITGPIRATNGVVSGSSQVIGILSSLNNYTSSNDTLNTTQNSRLDQLSTASGSAINRLTALEVETSNLEIFSGSQLTQNNTLATYTGSIENRFTTLATYTSSVENRFTTLATYTGSVDSKFTTLATHTGSVNTRLTEIGVVSGSLISSASVVSQSVWYLHQFSSSENGKSATLATYTGSVETRFTEIGLVSGSLILSASLVSSSVWHLHQFSASATASLARMTASIVNHEGRITYIEGLALGGIDLNAQFAALQIVTSSLQNTTASLNVSVSNLNQFSGSQLTQNNTLATLTASYDSRWSALATTTGSLQTSVTNLNIFTASVSTASLVTSITNLNLFSSSALTRLTALEVETANLETFTSSINTTIKNRLNVEGVLSGSSQVFSNISGDVLIASNGAATIQANSVALGTDTTGNYMSDVTAGTGVTISHTPGEGSNATISIGQAVATSSNVRFNSIGVGLNATGVAGEIVASADIIAFSSSDIRLKENIKPITNALDKVKQISGNTYDWKEGYDEIHSHKGNDVGVIAQEIEQILPQIVTNRDTGFKAIQYEKIIPLLIEAIKELSAKVDRLENK